MNRFLEKIKKTKYMSYDVLVNSYIRQKYTESQEFAILRQKDEKPQEYKEYFDYCEQCKVKAKKKSGGAENGV